MINITLTKLFISFTIIISTLLTLSFINLYNTWFMLEISSMSMTSLMMINNSKKASITYFMMSFISSSILFLSINLYQLTNFYNMNNWLMMCIIISLMLKMGLIPFHKWMINISTNLNWWNMFMMLMFMKIIPIYMMYQFMYKMNMYIIYMLIINMLMSTFIAMNKMSLKKIMTFSSINQTSFLIMMMYMNMNLFSMYLMIYLISSIILFMYLNLMNMNNKNMLIMHLNKKNKFMYLILMTTYSNLPPMMTFILKWSMIENFINYDPSLMLMIMLMMISSLIMSWNYLNLNNLNLFMNNINMNFNMFMYNNYLNKYFYLINFILTSMFMFYSYMMY